jgi:hypothetical protein
MWLAPRPQCRSDLEPDLRVALESVPHSCTAVTHRYPYPDVDHNSDRDPNPNSYPNAYSDPNPNPNAYSDPNPNPNSYSYSDPNPNSYPRAQHRRCFPAVLAAQQRGLG